MISSMIQHMKEGNRVNMGESFRRGLESSKTLCQSKAHTGRAVNGVSTEARRHRVSSLQVGRAPRGTGRGPVPLGVGLAAGLSEGPAAVLAPCTACGRPEQPERLHSHPPPPSAAAASALRGPGRTRSPRAGGAVTSMAAAGAGAGDAPKSSVRKPVALKYRSGGGGGGASPRGGRAPAPGAATAAANGSAGVSGGATPEAAATSAPTQTTAPATTMDTTHERGPSGRTAARGFLLCYLCGRAFGRASLPLHEPHCLQRWQRENDALPPSLRRPPPERPAAPAAALSPDQWNRMAWEASQLRLVPCSRCGRTFAPDRLPVHERSCRAAPVTNTAAASTAATTTVVAPATTATSSEQRGSGDEGATSAAVSRPPGSVPCEWCGRLFGSASIAIHAPQCAARPTPGSAAEETTRPLAPAATIAVVAVASSRGGARGRGGRVGARGGRAVGSERAASATAAAATSAMVAVGAGGAGGTWAARRPSLCYLCGRPFGRASIAIHERACRERWRRENERLPPHLRRQEPEKPCVVYRADGSMDMAGTMEAIWQSHLEQLVPCVHCGRTFYPDRLEVHQRACKGPRR